MATASTVILDYYGPGVFTASVIGVIALLREIRKSRRENLGKLNNLIHQLELYRSKFDDSRIDLDRLMQEFPLVKETVAVLTPLLREFPPVKEGLAVLAAEYENHERYHERHNL